MNKDDDILPYSPQAIRPRRLPMAWILVLLGALLLLAVLLTQTQRNDGRHAYIVNLEKCRSNLRCIGQACHLYMNENHGQYPLTFDLLFSTQDLNADTACCPSSNTQPPATQPGASWFNFSSSYSYHGAGLDQSVPPRVIVAHDRLGNHASDGLIHVLYADGQVERIDLTDFPAAVAASDTLRKQWQASRSTTTTPIR